MILLEWNIHKMLTPSNIDPCICKEITEEQADIICLVEYLHDSIILEHLKDDYIVTSSKNEGGNDVLIAIKKGIVAKDFKIVDDKEVKECYRFLHISFVDKNNRELSIIGIRMLSPMEAKIQTPPLKEYLEDLVHQNKTFICAGDFNIIRNNMTNWFPSLQLGKYNRDEYSYIFTNKYTSKIIGYEIVDHVITSNDIEAISHYSWDFTKGNSFIYPNTRSYDTKWNIPVGYPDHAKMITEIEFIKDEKNE